MKKHYRHENDCLNCGTILEGKFCHNCGQENLEIKESFGHMMNHAISDYFHFDHMFFHTLKPLLFKPGFLTNEYTAGRRAQYLHPVKMYIFISIVYFLLLFQSGHEAVKVNNTQAKQVSTKKIIDSVNNEISKDRDLSAEQKKAIQKKTKLGYSSAFVISDDSTYNQYAERQNKLAPKSRDGFFQKIITEKLLTYNEKYGPRAKEVFADEIQHNIPKMMFVLLPLFALILAITFRKNKKYYVEQLIYAFHLHCFFFLFFGTIILLEMIIPGSWKINEWLSFLATIYTIWYIYKSLRVVYHRGWFSTTSKITVMFITYSIAFCVCMALLVLITAITII